MYRIQLRCHGNMEDKHDELDFILSLNPGERLEEPGSVCTFTTENNALPKRREIASPRQLANQTRESLAPAARALVGNAGGELTFRHVVRSVPKNVRNMLWWAEKAYEVAESRLVLGPMDYDLIHDVMMGAPLLRWSAQRSVPLAVFCGYRFLFPEDAFGQIQWACEQHPMSNFANPYRYPYAQVSRAIRKSGAEVWTGAGRIDGLRAGILQVADDFGMSGVFTFHHVWDSWFNEAHVVTNNYVN